MSDRESSTSTTPEDLRYPNVNQSQHCWARYNEYLLCMKATGDDEDACAKRKHYFRAICPDEWVEEWDELREAGNFPGVSALEPEEHGRGH